MITRTRLVLPAALAALAVLAAAGCGSDTTESAADKAAQLATEQQQNPPTVTDVNTSLKVVKVKPSAGESDLKKKPAIPKQTGDAPTELVAQDLIVGTGKEAKEGDTASVQYVGVLYDTGKEFDSSWKRGAKPFAFQLGGGQVIQGWDQGVVGMKVGGRRRLIIPAELAYGAQGSPPTIPANAALVFDVDLEKVTAGGK